MSINGYDPIYPFEGCELTFSELSKTKRNALRFVNQLPSPLLSPDGGALVLENALEGGDANQFHSNVHGSD